MIEQIGENLTCRCFYTSGGAAKTGLTVTVDVYNPAGTQIVTGASATEIGSSGVYQYTLSSASVTTAGLYSFIFKTSDTTVDIKDFQLGYDVGTDWVEHVDADISSRSDFDETTDTVTTDTASRDASKADVSLLALEATSQTILEEIDTLLLVSDAVSFVATGQNITTGTVISGSYIDTQNNNESYFQVQESGGSLDYYLEFNIGEKRISTRCAIHGRYEEAGPPYDNTIDSYAYNWNTTSWDHISPASGDFTHSTTDEIKEFNLNENHVDASGNVRIRLAGSTLDTGSNMYIDYMFVNGANNISNLSTLTDAEVWTYTTRGLTELVTTDSASRTASQADVSALSLQSTLLLVKTATDRLEALIEDVGGDRYTAKALEQAPSGGGGSTPAEIWSYTTRTLTAFPGGGSGLRSITIQIYETGTTDAIGDTLISIVTGGTTYAYGITDISGQFVCNLDDGIYDIRLRRSNTYFSGSETLTVSGDGTHIYYGTIPSIPTPTLPSDCYLYEDLRGINGDVVVPEDDMIAKITIVTLPYNYSGYLWTGQTIEMDYDENSGRAFIEIVRLATVKLEIPTHGVKAIKTIPDAASVRWSDIS